MRRPKCPLRPMRFFRPAPLRPPGPVRPPMPSSLLTAARTGPPAFPTSTPNRPKTRLRRAMTCRSSRAGTRLRLTRTRSPQARTIRPMPLTSPPLPIAATICLQRHLSPAMTLTLPALTRHLTTHRQLPLHWRTGRPLPIQLWTLRLIPHCKRWRHKRLPCRQPEYRRRKSRLHLLLRPSLQLRLRLQRRSSLKKPSIRTPILWTGWKRCSWRSKTPAPERSWLHRTLTPPTRRRRQTQKLIQTRT
ncbi:hypothetical protein AN901_201654 [Pseudomonas syringae pv. theae]|nr:hypothetical protein AN901_201654 [Pseudomonas syringae pv. theae]